MLKLVRSSTDERYRIKDIKVAVDEGIPYKVEKAKIETDEGDFIERRVITRDGIPEYQVNDFLLDKGLSKKTTNYTYAYSLVKLLNFLRARNIEYVDCTQYQAKQYVRYLIFGEMEDLKVLDQKNKVSYSTISRDITVMNEFFRFLKSEQIDIQMQFENKKIARKRAFLYGQIVDYDYIKIVEKNVKNLKPSKRYLKWYEEEHKNSILSNFTCKRDSVVFLLTLEGMRIDEVLSLQLQNIDYVEQTVQPSRSKRKRDLVEGDEEIRIVSLPTDTFEKLNEYIETERADAESESGIFSDHVFINIKRNSSQGKVLTYHNYRKILKGASRRGGLDSKTIRTHSGRSTKVNELLEHQVLHPEDHVTDEMIRQMMGWESPDSINPYKNRQNKVIAKAAAEKVRRK